MSSSSLHIQAGGEAASENKANQPRHRRGRSEWLTPVAISHASRSRWFSNPNAACIDSCVTPDRKSDGFVRSKSRAAGSQLSHYAGWILAAGWLLLCKREEGVTGALVFRGLILEIYTWIGQLTRML